MAKRANEIVWVTGSNDRPRHALTELLGSSGHLVAEYATTRQALARLEAGSTPSVVLLEVDPYQKEVEEVVTRFVQRLRPIPVIAIAPRTASTTLVRRLTSEVAECLETPFDSAELEQAIASVLVRGQRSDVASVADRGVYESLTLVVRSPAMRRLEESVRRVADTDLTIVIQGESGTGKDLMARFIHSLSSRRERPFVKVNCAAIPDPLLESELFGYERGAFTGAEDRKPGRFQMAHEGTILLDEIGETSPQVQAKLLQVLQDKRFTPLGSDEEMQVDFRILAACNKSLEAEVQTGRFREDLYFRLHVIDLHLPRLRDRPEEIPALVGHFSRRFALRYRRPQPRVSRELMDRFLAYHWPGNVRELENMIRRIVLLGEESSVMRWILHGSENGPRGSPLPEAPLAPARNEGESPLSLKRVAQEAALEAQRQMILDTLDATRWNRRKAAGLLGVSYNTLLNRIKHFGLNED